jgi:adenine-specific DNA-methyltransferase
LHSRVFDALMQITPAQVISEGRVYGGGLHKVEPNELAQLPATPVLKSIGLEVWRVRQELLFP